MEGEEGRHYLMGVEVDTRLGQHTCQLVVVRPTPVARQLPGIIQELGRRKLLSSRCLQACCPHHVSACQPSSRSTDSPDGSHKKVMGCECYHKKKGIGIMSLHYPCLSGTSHLYPMIPRKLSNRHLRQSCIYMTTQSVSPSYEGGTPVPCVYTRWVDAHRYLPLSII